MQRPGSEAQVPGRSLEMGSKLHYSRKQGLWLSPSPAGLPGIFTDLVMKDLERS